jgi:hypothetical protein
MIDALFVEFLEALNRCMIDNNDGTFTVRATRITGGVATNPKRTPPNLAVDMAKKLITDNTGTLSLNVY